MKVARFSRLLLQIRRFRSRNYSRSNFCPTKVKPIPRSISWEESRTELLRRIYPVGDPKLSIVPILDQWVAEGRYLDQQSLKDIIFQLRSHRRYSHALEVSMWMTDKGYFELNSWDAYIRLALISKVQGMEQAEKYFNNLSQLRKDVHVYCALLNCYTSAQCVEKAEAVMQKMREMGYAKRILEYNLMLNLYYKTGNMEKLDALLQEMEANAIVRDKFTLSIQLSAYAAVMDIEKMDKIVTMMESDPNFVSNWTDYTVAAAGYTKAGLLDKAFEMLKKAEARVPTKAYDAYNTLLTHYAMIGRKDEVLRVWSLYKKKYRVSNKGYTFVLKSLVMLGDIKMAEEIFDEWESQGLAYNMRLPNIMIHAYSSKGFIKKAEALIDRAVSKGGKTDVWTWYPLVEGYLQNEQPQKAVEMMKKTILLLSGFKWEPVPEIARLKACLEYLKGVGDTEQTEEFVKLLVGKDIISLDKLEELSTVKNERLIHG